MELVIFLEKKQRILTQMKVVVLEMTSCRKEKNENPRFYRQNKLLFWQHAL
jgi:hypothetical protein